MRRRREINSTAWIKYGSGGVDRPIKRGLVGWGLRGSALWSEGEFSAGRTSGPGNPGTSDEEMYSIVKLYHTYNNNLRKHSLMSLN